MTRTRIRFVGFAVATAAVGLFVFRAGGALPPAMRDVLGDALWAAMVTWWIAAAAPTARRPWRAVLALALCFVIEFSQLHHAPALDAFRRTTIGHLLLGSGFDSRDLIAYAAGVFGAVLVERATTRRAASW